MPNTFDTTYATPPPPEPDPTPPVPSGPPSRTVAEMCEEIETRLGDGVVILETDKRHSKQAVKDAVREFNRNVPQRSRAKLNATSGTKKYLLDHPGIAGVIDVQFIHAQTEFGDPFDPLLLNDHTGLSLTGDTYGEINQRLTYIQDARRVSSTEPDWYAQWERDADNVQRYYLYVDIGQLQTQVGYEYSWHVTCDDDAVTGVRHFRDADVGWILDFALARLKQTLGRVRAKFGGVPNPDGGVDEIDGTALVQEGKEEEQTLMQDIKRRRRSLVPLIE